MLLCVLVHWTFEPLSVKWVWKYAPGRQSKFSLPFYRSHHSRFKERKWFGCNYLAGSDRSRWETQFFPFLFHYSFHSASLPFKMTGYEREFFAYCYFGLCRHSIPGDTPHQHTPTSAHYSLPKTFLLKTAASVCEVIAALMGGCPVFNARLLTLSSPLNVSPLPHHTIVYKAPIASGPSQRRKRLQWLGF